jgi:hypothetical protein
MWENFERLQSVEKGRFPVESGQSRPNVSARFLLLSNAPMSAEKKIHTASDYESHAP